MGDKTRSCDGFFRRKLNLHGLYSPESDQTHQGTSHACRYRLSPMLEAVSGPQRSDLAFWMHQGADGFLGRQRR
jgi:hypothetical protein